MKRLFTTLFMVACICGLLVAQTPVPPLNLQGTADGTTVNLTWQTPETIITHVTAGFYGGGAFTGNLRFFMAHRYTQAELAAYGVVGLQITKIGYTPFVRATDGGNTRVQLYVWTGVASGGNPGDNYTMRYPNMTYNAGNPDSYIEFTTAESSVWNDISLPNPVTIPNTGEVWVGLEVVSAGADGYPMTYDQANNPNTSQNMIRVQGYGWQTLSSAYQNGNPRNLMLRATASYSTGAPSPIVFGHDIEDAFVDDLYSPFALFREASAEEKEQFILSNQPTRAFAGYKVYRGEWGSPSLITLTPSPITTQTYSETDVPNNAVHIYHVTTVTTSPDAQSPPATVEVAVGSDPLITLYPYVQLFDSYPSVFPPFLWTALSNNGNASSHGDDWQHSIHVFNAYSGHGAALSLSWGGGQTFYNPDELLISPHFTKPTLSGESLYVTFQAKNREPGEGVSQYYQNFTVMKSTTGALFSDFTAIGDQHSLQGIDGWQGFAIDITNEIADGQNFYIGIWHHDSSNGNGLFIDNFRLDVIPTANATFHAPSGVSSSLNGSVVALSWSAPSPANSNLAGYNIYRDGIKIGHANTTAYTDDVTFNGDYFYEVAAVYNIPPAESERVSHTATVTAGKRYLFNISNIRHTVTTEGGAYNAALSWDPPQEGTTISITQAAEEYEWGITFSDMPEITYGHRYDESDLATLGVNGGYIDTVSFVPRAGRPYQSTELVWASVEYKIMIFNGSSWAGSDADGNWYNIGQLVYEQVVDKSQLVESDWTDIKLNSPVPVPLYDEIIIAIDVKATSLVTQTPFVLLTDAGPYHIDKGDLYLDMSDGTCYSLLGGSSPYNIMLKASIIPTVQYHNLTNIAPTIVGSTTKPAISSGHISRLLANPIVTPATHTSTKRSFGSSITTTRDVRTPTVAVPDAYRVYLGLQGTTPALPEDGQVTESTYTATGLGEGTYQARITAIYGEAPNQIETTAIPYYFFAGDVTITEFPFQESFEAPVFPPPGWSSFNNANPPHNGTWFKYIPTTAAHNGTAVAASNTTATWIVTPRIRIPAGLEGSFPFSFYARGSTAAGENLNVYYSIEGPAQENTWVALGGQTALTGGNWTVVSRQLPNSVSGSDVWIAIRRGGGEQRLEIDSFYMANPNSDYDESVKPFTNALIANYPNPFNPETTIAFSVAKEGFVSLDIYNIKGQRVNRLVNDVMKPGMHNVVWNGKDGLGHDVASGIYFYRLNVGSFSESKKMILLK